ncbi:flagellar biosynthetic protein FliR [Candidatus Magnetomonas plexicatena]|uniref:flagellar biosynthetic protein FliR n=1 Tax=Candidatus Magnetomonas plexicatena TaxID=2552947 RepID=UPI001C7486BA|nr:flagellar biosynthetic protein FliR [Nitrospirales bacterium LBB_01]
MQELNQFIDAQMASQQIGNFLFILIRTSIFMAMMPVFSSANVPRQIKIGFAVALAVLLSPVVNVHFTEDERIPLFLGKEVLFSMLFAGAARFVFTAVNMAGTFISNSMSLSVASTFDPEFGQSAEISRLLGIILTLLFVAMDAHHDLITMFVKSYELLPPGRIILDKSMIYSFLGGTKLFVLAIKIAAPITVGMLAANLLLGLLYKAAPQINIFFVSFPIFIFVGLTIMIASLPVMIYIFGINIANIKHDMYRAMELSTK